MDQCPRHRIGCGVFPGQRRAGRRRQGRTNSRVGSARDAPPLSLAGHQGWVTSLAYSADGQWLLSGGFDNTVRVWDAKQGTLIKQLVDHTQWIRCVAFAPAQAQRVAVSAGNAGCLQLWHLDSAAAAGPRLGEPLHWHMIAACAVSPDGQLLAAAGWSHTVRLWEMQTGRLLAEVAGHTGTVFDLAWCGNTKLLSASEDHTVRLWEMPSGRELKRLLGHDGAVRSVSVSSDLQTIASTGEDGMICLWPPEPNLAESQQPASQAAMDVPRR